MNTTPNANRKHIGIYGKTNAGKSSLINALLNQDLCLVSPVKGTTTDPVYKAMELIPFGPVLFIDTAGLEDYSELGKLRIGKTKETLKRAEFALYVIDATDEDEAAYHEMLREFKRFNIPYLVVVNKIDLVQPDTLNHLQQRYKEAIFLSSSNQEEIEYLRRALIEKLSDGQVELPIVGDLVPYGGTVVLVVPIDSEAPKGRIILPQVQVIRDCLDHGIQCMVVRDTELEAALQALPHVDLVITDSQAFKAVNKMVPNHIMLTSFSILFARYKGDLNPFVQGARKVSELNADSKILICESCTHNVSHEDIGRVKIPKLLNDRVGANLDYTYKVGHDFPEDASEYDLIIHCGACMVNRKSMLNKLQACKEQGVAVTNYGVILAELTGILNRTLQLFESE